MTETNAVPLWPWNEPQEHCRLIRKLDGSYWWAPKDVEVPTDFAVVVEDCTFEYALVVMAIVEDTTRSPVTNYKQVVLVAVTGILALVLLCLWMFMGGPR